VRLKLHFALTDGPGMTIPVNHNTWLVSAIYRWLALSSPRFADFIHNEGYRLNGKPYKLFCFSRLCVKNRNVRGDRLKSDSGTFSWFIASPKDDFINHLLTGLNKDPSMMIDDVRATAESVETSPLPELLPPVKFVCLSPITASVWDAESRRNPTRYLDPGEEFTAAVRLNLTRKYRLVHKTQLEDDRLTMTFDQGYMRRIGRITKLIDFKGIKVRGILCPFVADGSSDLIRIGYECGFGEKNSIGFGMVEARS